MYAARTAGLPLVSDLSKSPFASRGESKPNGDRGDLTEVVVMKSQIRVKLLAMLPGVNVMEMWHDGQFLATISGGDGPDVRIITKHAVKAKPAPDDGSGVSVRSGHSLAFLFVQAWKAMSPFRGPITIRPHRFGVESLLQIHPHEASHFFAHEF